MIFRDLDTSPAIDVSRETLEKLHDFGNMILKWTKHVNLVSEKSAAEIWNRHIIDSAQLLPIAPQQWRHWVDLGSGAGLPGMVVAILEQERHPDRLITLIESDQRKCAFLRTINQQLGLRTRIISERIESVPPLAADVLSARALGPLHMLLGHCERHLAPAGVAILPKGRRVGQEISDAKTLWQFDVAAHPSVTDTAGQILRIERITRA